MRNASKLGAVLIAATLFGPVRAQVPDQMTAFDPGGASMGMGGALQATGSDTLSAYYNPAGLAFLSHRQFGIDYRNIPKSFTLSSGQFNSRTLKTNGLKGATMLTHVGLTTPLHHGAVVGLTYTLGGVMEDQQLGSGLLLGADAVANYELDRSLRTEFYTLAFAQASKDQSTSFGLGLNYVRQHTAVREGGIDVQVVGNQINLIPIASPANGTDNGYGYGFTAGLQGTPASNPDFSWGISYRSPVDLKGLPHTGFLFDRIPRRLLGGVALRKNARSDNYWVIGATAANYSGGHSSGYVDRTNQTTLGVGLEYDLARLGGRVPLRVGYKTVPSGGDGFTDRNEFTYGAGYRSADGKIEFDANFGSPAHGGYDIGVGLTVRFGR